MIDENVHQSYVITWMLDLIKYVNVCDDFLAFIAIEHQIQSIQEILSQEVAASTWLFLRMQRLLTCLSPQPNGHYHRHGGKHQ